MEFENIILDIDGPVAVIILNRPKVLNALNLATVRELDRAVDHIKANSDIRALVLTGGTKNFAAGADIGEMVGLDPEGAKSFGFQKTYRKIETLPIPVLAAVAGFALGGGLELAMACDMRIFSQDAKVGLPEIKLGIFPGAGGTQRLPRLVGVGRAKEMIYTGKIIDGRTAVDYGLCNWVAKGNVVDETLEMARRLAQGPPVALAGAKKAIHCAVDTKLDHGLEYEADTWAGLFSSFDQKEGMAAFMEKRKANFKGK